jgi:hypothetical protein
MNLYYRTAEPFLKLFGGKISFYFFGRWGLSWKSGERSPGWNFPHGHAKVGPVLMVYLFP